MLPRLMKRGTPISLRPAPAAPAGIQTVAFVSLGCPKNLVDSEKMLGLLAEDGLIPVADHAQADAIVINTCGFLEASKVESISEIQEAARLKQAGSCKRLIVAGCLVQRHRAKMLAWCPDIDALIGVFDRDHIVQAVRGPAGSGTRGRTGPARANRSTPEPVYASIAGSAAAARKARGITAKGYFEDDAGRLRLTPRHYAYLRISEGCNQNCAFCTIPSIRGKMRSKPVDRILAEARELLADGAFELNLIGQDTTSFGQDLGDTGGLVGMLTALDRVAGEHGGAWLRLMYAYPSCFTDAMIDALANLPRLVKYIDMPLQHISDPVLDAMRRRTSRSLIETLLGKLRSRVPGLAIRTTFITGYPGETAKQHRELVTFVKDFGFDAMGVFPYSAEPGTPAGTLHAQGQAVPEAVVQERLEELMLAQQAVAFERQQAMADRGAEVEVLIDAPAAAGELTGHKQAGETTAPARRTPARGMLYVGRTQAQAPQVDSVTYVLSRQPLTPGEVVPSRVTDHQGYDLIAQPAVDLEKRIALKLL